MDSIVDFMHSGKKVGVHLDTGLPVEDPILLMVVLEDSEVGAAAITEALRRRARQLAVDARRESYEAGYADGRARRKKVTEFPVKLRFDTEKAPVLS